MSATIENATIASRDGTPLHVAWTDDPPKSKGVVLLVHGFAEHMGRYRHVMEWLHAHGWSSVGIELRGHGHSGGRRSYVEAFDEYLQDVDALVAHARERLPKAKIFMLGHSMGGLIAASWSCRNPTELDGVLLSSPFFGLAAKVPALKKAAGRLLSRVWPTLALAADLPPEHLSHAPEVGRAYAADPLVNKGVTARWFTEVEAAQQKAFASAGSLQIPLWVGQAGDDRVALAAASKRYYESVGAADRTYVEYSGFFHEIFNEVERDKPLTDVVQWLDAHV